MRKSYKLFYREYCSAHVEICFDDDGKYNRIELWSYKTCVCGAYLDASGNWKIFSTGTYSQTTREHIKWFCSSFWVISDDWKLSYYLFEDVAEKCYRAIRKATAEEAIRIQDLAYRYICTGTPCDIHG